MPGLGKETVVVLRYLRGLRGGSQPILVEASDSHIYVLKFPGNPQGANVVFNEVVGTELYRACHLPTPQWKPLLVTDDFLDRNRACWFLGPNGPVRPRAGLCFGSRYLGTEKAQIFEILPGTRFATVHNREDFWLAWAVDACARHTDNRQAIFVEEKYKRIRAVFIDQGSMFGGAAGTRAFHFCAPRYLDRHMYGPPSLKFARSLPIMAAGLDARPLWKTVEALPPDWKSDSGLENVAACLERLTNPSALREIFQRLVYSLSYGSKNGTCFAKPEGESLLRPGLCDASGAQSAVA